MQTELKGTIMTEHTRSRKWIKRAVIGGTAAVMIGGGIGVTANAVPGQRTVIQAQGFTEAEALEVGKRKCANLNMDFGGQAGPANRISGSVLGPGRQDEIWMAVNCTEREAAANPNPNPNPDPNANPAAPPAP
jgi:hypothetical protein